MFSISCPQCFFLCALQMGWMGLLGSQLSVKFSAICGLSVIISAHFQLSQKFCRSLLSLKNASFLSLQLTFWPILSYQLKPIQIFILPYSVVVIGPVWLPTWCLVLDLKQSCFNFVCFSLAFRLNLFPDLLWLLAFCFAHRHNKFGNEIGLDLIVITVTRIWTARVKFYTNHHTSSL